MKGIKFIIFLIVVMLFFVSACNTGNQKQIDFSDTDSI